MIMAGVGVTGGTMTLGDFVLVVTYLMQLYLPLGFLGYVYREVKQSLTDMEAMFDLVQVPPDVCDREGAPPLVLSGGEVVFDDVSFGYRPDRPILKNVSFRVPAGRKVAIVGPSGAGKSTISRLLFRFYDVDGGCISIDGQDLRDITQDSLRGAIGIVPQDTVLFNDTVHYNIAYGRPGASDEEIKEAARLAAIHFADETQRDVQVLGRQPARARQTRRERGKTRAQGLGQRQGDEKAHDTKVRRRVSKEKGQHPGIPGGRVFGNLPVGEKAGGRDSPHPPPGFPPRRAGKPRFLPLFVRNPRQ